MPQDYTSWIKGAFSSPGSKTGAGSFNPYYTPSAGSSALGTAGAMGGNIISDIDRMNADGPMASYNNRNVNGAPDLFNNAYYNADANAMQKSYHPGAIIAGDAARYAAAGSAFGPWGALAGGIVGGVIGIADAHNQKDNIANYKSSIRTATNKYNTALGAYNSRQAGQDVSNAQMSQYAQSNPYSAPTSAYWY